MSACSGAAGLPLVSGNQIFEVLPAPLEEAILENRLAAANAAAIIKIGRHLEKIQRVLKRLELESKAIFVERASMENQRVLSILDPRLSEAAYFSMILIIKLN